MHGLYKYSTFRVSNHFLFSINDINNLSSRDHKLYYISFKLYFSSWSSLKRVELPTNKHVDKEPLNLFFLPWKRVSQKLCPALFLINILLSEAHFSNFLSRFINTQGQSFHLRSLTIENIVIPCFIISQNNSIKTFVEHAFLAPARRYPRVIDL